MPKSSATWAPTSLPPSPASPKSHPATLPPSSSPKSLRTTYAHARVHRIPSPSSSPPTLAKVYSRSCLKWTSEFGTTKNGSFIRGLQSWCWMCFRRRVGTWTSWGTPRIGFGLFTLGPSGMANVGLISRVWTSIQSSSKTNQNIVKHPQCNQPKQANSTPARSIGSANSRKGCTSATLPPTKTPQHKRQPRLPSTHQALKLVIYRDTQNTSSSLPSSPLTTRPNTTAACLSRTTWRLVKEAVEEREGTSKKRLAKRGSSCLDRKCFRWRGWWRFSIRWWRSRRSR